VNEQITAPQVRLIDENGEQQGIKPMREALSMARAVSLDLVEVSPTAQPPVCKILDFDKFRYDQRKREAVAKKKQKQSQVKELKYSVRIEEADYQVRLRNLIRFLESGDKVKVTLRFRGREMVHQELGVELLERLQTDVELYGEVESKPKLEGRQFVMLIGPKKTSAATR